MSNLIETSSIESKQKKIEKATFQKVCPAPPCTTPLLGTPPGPNNTPPQSPLIGLAKLRISRSNSACVSNQEKLSSFIDKKKSINKRRNTQLLQSANSHDLNSIHYAHRLQSLRTLAAGAQKSNKLISKGLLNDRILDEEFGESLDEDEMEDNYYAESISNDVSNDFSNESDEENKLNTNDATDSKNSNQINLTLEKRLLNETDENSVYLPKDHTSMKKSENPIVRKFKSDHDLDELIKENKKTKNDAVQENVQKIMAQAEIRKNQLLLLLDEHQQIVQKIKLAETNKY